MSNEQQTAAPQIYAAIQSVLNALTPVAKTEKNQQTRSSYRGYEQLQNAISPLLRDAGIFLKTEILEREQEDVPRQGKSPGRYCRVRVRLTFLSLADGSSISTEAIAGASDYGDFAETQALTYVIKNALQHALCIPTEKNKAYEKRKQELRFEADREAIESGEVSPETLAENTPETANLVPQASWENISKSLLPYEGEDPAIVLTKGKTAIKFIRLTAEQMKSRDADK